MRLLLDVSAVPARPVGAGVYTVELARALGQRDDVDLVLACRAGDRRRWRRLAPDALTLDAAPAKRPARVVWEQTRAHRLADSARVDVWHGPHYTMPRALDVPAVVTIHDLTFVEHPEWHERTKVAFFRRMLRSSARRAAVLVAISRHTAAGIQEHLRPRGEVVVVPHGVDHDRFRPGVDGDPDDLDLLRSIGVQPPFLAFAGTVEPRKDLPTLVAAFARVASSRPDLRLVLVGGDGWGSSDLHVAIERSGVATRIVRPGYIPDAALPALFRQSEAVVYPSLVEGFGLPALEALACGAPLVSTTGSAIEEIVGDAALLVAPHDEVALADAMRRVLDDETRNRRLRDAGPARAAPYTWTASAAGHVDAYRRAADVSASRPKGN
ncbi:MAG: glycosyltransferase [Actinomycetia bacterium]|nr:glycosyltransferase [Actinomycetes bacterium]